jgi:hypothetical protein
VAAFKGAYGAFVVTDFWEPTQGAREEEINRMLDPSDTGVTLATLTRASQILGLRVAIRLSPTRKSAA